LFFSRSVIVAKCPADVRSLRRPAAPRSVKPHGLVLLAAIITDDGAGNERAEQAQENIR
jgi:hypothetical protein